MPLMIWLLEIVDIGYSREDHNKITYIKTQAMRLLKYCAIVALVYLGLSITSSENDISQIL